MQYFVHLDWFAVLAMMGKEKLGFLQKHHRCQNFLEFEYEINQSNKNSLNAYARYGPWDIWMCPAKTLNLKKSMR